MEDDQPRKRMGRPPGSMSRLARDARAQAQATGRLPHEILLDIARGELIDMQTIDPATGLPGPKVKVVPPLEMRIDAAKSAAPYFAPKIATVEVIQGVDDAALDAIIESAAAQAGVSLGPSGEGEEEEDTGGEGGDAGASPPPRRVSLDAQSGTPPAQLRRRTVTGTGS